MLVRLMIESYFFQHEYIVSTKAHRNSRSDINMAGGKLVCIDVFQMVLRNSLF